jgi:hypothetical protein
MYSTLSPAAPGNLEGGGSTPLFSILAVQGATGRERERRQAAALQEFSQALTFSRIAGTIS